MKPLDFTSSLYLGFRHGSAELGPWRQLTVGRPSMVRRWPEAAALEASVARLCGTEAALIGRSTFHLFWDLVGALPTGEWHLCIDRNCYPIARWAADRFRSKGGIVRDFRHFDRTDLSARLERSAKAERRPVVITDSYCCSCGTLADLQTYCAEARTRKGIVVIDDTQGLGLLGRQPSAENPWGKGGGGSIRMLGLAHTPIVAVSSLAKTFGVPLAVAVGPARWLQKIKTAGESMLHCSQPTAADIRALSHALALNRAIGEERRAMLRQRLNVFRSLARSLGIPVTNFPHPSQALSLECNDHSTELIASLRERKVLCLPGADHRGRQRITFLLSALHSPSDIARALKVFAECLETRREASVSPWRVRRLMRERELQNAPI